MSKQFQAKHLGWLTAFVTLASIVAAQAEAPSDSEQIISEIVDVDLLSMESAPAVTRWPPSNTPMVCVAPTKSDPFVAWSTPNRAATKLNAQGASCNVTAPR